MTQKSYRKMIFSKIRDEYFPVTGGMDLVSTPMSIEPGRMIACLNYEELSTVRGSRRCDGYERFNGMPAPSSFTDAVEIANARAVISAIPGSGDVLGVNTYKGVKYAFRNHTDGLSAKMWKATSGGWIEVDTTAVPLVPGGTYEFVNQNFYGDSNLEKMYWVDGKNKLHIFDGITITAVVTGIGSGKDKPQHLEAHSDRLFISFRGGATWGSAVGDPTSYSAIKGAGDINPGDSIVSLKSIAKGVLAILCDNSIYMLYGNGTTDSPWDLKGYARRMGAYEWTCQHMGGIIYLDDTALTSLTATDKYSDFKSDPIAEGIQPFISARKNMVTASVISRAKGQYILFFSDKTGVRITISGKKVIAGTKFQLNHVATCAVSGKDSNGNEEIFFGSDNGMVYQLDKGTSFDGSAIDAVMRLAFNNFKSPCREKTFYRMTVELNNDANPSINLQILIDLNYSSVENPATQVENVTIYGGGGYFDVDYWDEVYWGEQSVGEAEVYLDGKGTNMSILIVSSSATANPHTIHGITISYSFNGRKG